MKFGRIHTLSAIGAVALAVGLAPAGPARAQAPHEMGATDKVELFLQHLGKVVQVEPEIYQSFLLEYELAASLAELGLPHPQPLLGDFIRRAVVRLHPRLGEAISQRQAGDAGAAAAALTELARDRDPYLAAQARLELAEIALAGGRVDEAIELAARVIQKERQFVIPDYRACEIIAAAFAAQKKPILEILQYSILLTDYKEIPADVETRAKERIAALEQEAGNPMKVVSSWMDRVEKLIDAFDTGEDPTRVQQGEILVALDKMIELQEARERNQCPNCGKGG